MLEEFRNIQSDKKTLRNFGLTIGTVVSLIALFFTLKSPNDIFQYILMMGLSFMVIGLSMPSLLSPINYLWMAFAIIIGWIMTHLILSALYTLIITPLGLTLKLFRKQLLSYKKDSSMESYWEKREIENDINNWEKQF